jgi:RNA polymerase sigma factor (sigma-70 family)
MVDLEHIVEQRHDVMAALAVLSPQQRACVTLRYLCDQTVDDVARALDCSPGNVKRHLHDALARLRAVLAPSQEHDHG